MPKLVITTKNNIPHSASASSRMKWNFSEEAGKAEEEVQQ